MHNIDFLEFSQEFAFDSSPSQLLCGGDGEVPEGDSLPCLYSNNAIQTFPDSLRIDCIKALCGILSPYHKRQAETLFLNVSRLISLAPSVGHIGFFTITTKDNVSDHAEFRRRWNSFRTNYFSKSPNFKNWIATYERQGAKAKFAWHLHILVILPYDIRTGIDFDQIRKRNYISASPFLRALWRELRGKLPAYNFGRHELLPIMSNADGMARYMGKYISKHLGNREERDKGKRLIASDKGWIKNSCKFAWNTDGAKEWRRKTAKFARILGCCDFDDMYTKLGPNWAYKHVDSIYNIDEFSYELNKGVPF